MKFLFKRTKEYTYNSLFFTVCEDCGKRIILDIPEKYKQYKKHGIFTCNNCVPMNSSIRNDIDESSFTDISNSLWHVE